MLSFPYPLSLTELSDLRALTEPGSELRKAFHKFLMAERLYFTQQMVDAVRAEKIDEARRYAAMDEAYDGLPALLEEFISRELKNQ